VALIHALSLSPAIGWRRDSFGDPHFSRGLTPAKRAVLEDRWKNAPVVVEFISKTRLQTALLSEQVGTWHVAAISNGNFGPWEERSALERDQLQQAGLLAGHRIGFSRLILPDTLVAGSSFDFVSHWYNDGVTPVYEPYVAQLCLSRGEKELWRAPLSMRPSALLPTKGSALAFTDKLTLPATLPPGEYMLAIRVDSEDGSRGPLTLAVATQRDSRLGYELGSVQVLAAAKAP